MQAISFGEGNDFWARANYDLLRPEADGRFAGLPLTGHIQINTDIFKDKNEVGETENMHVIVALKL